MTMTKALIGSTGFVGTTLRRYCQFDGLYNSKNITNVRGESFDLVICAAAPATMWAANQDPDADKANLDRLVAELRHIRAEHFVLISTIAVFDDASAGYTESNARYEVGNAYGRHRRELEERLAEQFQRYHIMRLPALFGPGLKKNFIFDLLNPTPSFIKPDKFASLQGDFSVAEAYLLSAIYTLDMQLDMWKLDRERLKASPNFSDLAAAFERIGFVSRNFTNSASQFQYYNMSRLARDIERVLQANLDVINICSEPLVAADICQALTGQPFINDGPRVVHEDMRTVHATALGGSGPYLFDRTSVLDDLKAFFVTEAAR